MNWLSRLTGNIGSTTTIKIADKDIEVRCSASADKALAQRAQPLIMEIELAFACFVRKTVLFHDAPTRGENVIEVHEKLALVITKIIPDACDGAGESKSMAGPALRNFMPKWIRVDYTKGKWQGEYGL